MLEYGKDVTVEDGVIINVKEGFIGDRSIIRSGARIEGTSIILGAESYLDHGAWIGGGSCFDSQAYLMAGDWLHMGWNSHLNTARGIDIGHELGLGVESKVFTHGAYLAIDDGFPVQWGSVKIGDCVWLPHAWVNPNVTIGNNVVVAAMSLVNKNLPSGCIAGGIPAKIIKEKAYPKIMEYEEVDKLITKALLGTGGKVNNGVVYKGKTCFNITERIIDGPVTEDTEKIKNQLRRNGIRFRYTAKEGKYVSWLKY